MNNFQLDISILFLLFFIILLLFCFGGKKGSISWRSGINFINIQKWHTCMPVFFCRHSKLSSKLNSYQDIHLLLQIPIINLRWYYFTFYKLSLYRRQLTVKKKCFIPLLFTKRHEYIIVYWIRKITHMTTKMNIFLIHTQ